VKTANGMPATWFGYWLGRLLCRLGIHKVGQLTQWEYFGRGDHVIRWCIRDCQWGDDYWTGDRKSRGTGS